MQFTSPGRFPTTHFRQANRVGAPIWRAMMQPGIPQ
jgi:hypothetical protein